MKNSSSSSTRSKCAYASENSPTVARSDSLTLITPFNNVGDVHAPTPAPGPSTAIGRVSLAGSDAASERHRDFARPGANATAPSNARRLVPTSDGEIPPPLSPPPPESPPPPKSPASFRRRQYSPATARTPSSLGSTPAASEPASANANHVSSTHDVAPSRRASSSARRPDDDRPGDSPPGDSPFAKDEVVDDRDATALANEPRPTRAANLASLRRASATTTPPPLTRHPVQSPSRLSSVQTSAVGESPGVDVTVVVTSVSLASSPVTAGSRACSRGTAMTLATAAAFASSNAHVADDVAPGDPSAAAETKSRSVATAHRVVASRVAATESSRRVSSPNASHTRA